MHRVEAVAEGAQANRLGDLILGQPELLTSRLVAQRCAFALPFFILVAHG
jgi:hypothetical protein